MSLIQSHSKGDQGRKEGGARGDVAGCTGKDVSGIEAVENAAFGVQSMDVDEVGGSNAVAS